MYLVWGHKLDTNPDNGTIIFNVVCCYQGCLSPNNQSAIPLLQSLAFLCALSSPSCLLFSDLLPSPPMSAAMKQSLETSYEVCRCTVRKAPADIDFGVFEKKSSYDSNFHINFWIEKIPYFHQSQNSQSLKLSMVHLAPSVDNNNNNNTDNF